jgi:hypothetical protein
MATSGLQPEMPLVRFCHHCNTFHEDACPNTERRRYATSPQRQIRSTARWQQQEQQRERETGTAAEAADRRRVSRCITFMRSRMAVIRSR